MSGKAKRSRTTLTVGAPYEWVDCKSCESDRDVENELDERLAERCPTQGEFEVRCAEVDALKARARAGKLSSSDDPETRDEISPVSTQPLLWEIRFRFADQPFRLYHAEPPAEPSVLLALKSHWKSTSGSAVEITDAQNLEMAHAARRYALQDVSAVRGLR